MITIKDIAKRCGVSPSTVSKVIKDYPNIPEETKKRVREVRKKPKQKSDICLTLLWLVF